MVKSYKLYGPHMTAGGLASLIKVPNMIFIKYQRKIQSKVDRSSIHPLSQSSCNRISNDERLGNNEEMKAKQSVGLSTPLMHISLHKQRT